MNENATYQQLMLIPNDELTKPQKTFLSVHNEMVMAGQKATECLLIMANDMRRMRDEKLYEAAGFETFKDYVETALNIKERQAYNWISVLDLPDAYLTKNVGMGVTKLTLIASASDGVAEELMNDEATSGKTVRELKVIIKKKEQELTDATEQLRLSEDDLINKDDEIRELKEELATEREKSAEVDTSEYEEKIEMLSARLEETNAQLSAANGKIAESEATIKDLKKKKKEVVEKTVEKTVEIENPETQKALEQAQKDAEAARAAKAEAEAAAEQYQKELAAYKKTQEAVATFKIHAGDLFDAWDIVMEAVKQIKAADPEYAVKCVAKLVAFNDTVKSDIEGVQ